MLQLEWTQPPNDYPTSDGKPMGETDIHRDLLFQQVKTLEHHYRDRPDVYVSGNILWFYREGDRRHHLSPDVMVCFGIPKAIRLNYLQWEEGPPPQVVIELTSRSTRREDVGRKLRLYEELGVEEYYIFDPPLDKALRAPKLSRKARKRPRLQSFFRVGGLFVPGQVSARASGKVEELHGPDLRAYSPRLGLELLVLDGELRLRDLRTQEVLLDPTERAEYERNRAEYERSRAEQAFARADQESLKAELASARAEQESLKAARAEREVAELRKLLDSLSSDKGP